MSAHNKRAQREILSFCVALFLYDNDVGKIILRS